MNSSALRPLSRFSILVAAVGLFCVLFLPIWRIELDAPQYPEGLKLQIYANDIKGDVDIINGLNHYIGMKTLHKADFIEFSVLSYIIIVFALLFILVAVLNKRRWLNLLFVFFICFGVVAMVDFWRWEYNYGHNLNPDAAIIVPGMAYQPPLIGFKQLLNFGAFSIPDIGGWIFIGAGLILLIATIVEWKWFKKTKSALLIAIPTLWISLTSCSSGPQPMVLGKDNCHLCKMTITDARFGAEIITKKGRVYKFDDIFCLVSYLKADTSEQQNLKDIYFVDYIGKHQFIKSNTAFLFSSPDLHSPMNGNIAAFESKEKSKEATATFSGSEVKWVDLLK